MKKLIIASVILVLVISAFLRIREYKSSAKMTPTEKFDTALIYRDGANGAKQSDRLYLKWLEASAAEGFSTAQLYLGAHYAEAAHGLKKNYDKAAYWLHKAEQNNRPESYPFLGTIYRNESYKNSNCAKATTYFKKYYNADKKNAGLFLGELYFNGCGEIQDDKLAFKYYNDIAALPDAPAHSYYIIGRFYEAGRAGLRPNIATAQKYYQKAADKGYSLPKKTA